MNSFFYFLLQISRSMPNKDKNFIARISITLLLLVAGVMFSLTLVSYASASGIAPDDVIALANDSRSKEGLPLLAENIKLSEAAQAKAHDMLKNDYFAHTSPSGRDPWYWIKQAGYQYKAAGENLAINFTSAKEEQSAWMKSQTHRANILNANYQEIGVAVVEGKIDGQNSVVTVQLFGTPMYAVADQMKTIVPPIAQKAPAEIKGTETIAEETSVPNTVPVLPVENIIPQKIIQTLPIQKTSWLDVSFLVFAMLLALSALATPVAFLAQACEHIITTIKVKQKEAQEVMDNSSASALEYHLRI
jgi:Cysteine-rich secretory protein family